MYCFFLLWGGGGYPYSARKILPLDSQETRGHYRMFSLAPSTCFEDLHSFGSTIYVFLLNFRSFGSIFGSKWASEASLSTQITQITS